MSRYESHIHGIIAYMHVMFLTKLFVDIKMNVILGFLDKIAHSYYSPWRNRKRSQNNAPKQYSRYAGMADTRVRSEAVAVANITEFLFFHTYLRCIKA